MYNYGFPLNSGLKKKIIEDIIKKIKSIKEKNINEIMFLTRLNHETYLDKNFFKFSRTDLTLQTYPIKYCCKKLIISKTKNQVKDYPKSTCIKTMRKKKRNLNQRYV
mgnify:CR=1 FL=1